VHGSDSAAAAARELRFFFPALAPPPPDAAARAAALAAGAAPAAAALRRAAVEAYMGERLEPVLAEALAELARGKPAAGSGDATAWLARWLLDHGPAQARRACASVLWHVYGVRGQQHPARRITPRVL